jgi:hypothetical protein
VAVVHQPVNDKARTAFTAILADPITHKGTPPALQGAQADADLNAGAQQAGVSVIRVSD